MKERHIKLTKIRRQTLEMLLDGRMMEISSMNEARIGSEPVAQETRYFLTKNRLIERKDKTKSVTTKGNGFIISDKGLRVLSYHGVELDEGEIAERRADQIIQEREIEREKRRSKPPTEAQIDYAEQLGIAVPKNATKADLSELISRKKKLDSPEEG